MFEPVGVEVGQAEPGGVQPRELSQHHTLVTTVRHKVVQQHHLCRRLGTIIRITSIVLEGTQIKGWTMIFYE